jgi:hypothetical protein
MTTPGFNGPARDPLAVAYDGEVNARLNSLIAGTATTQGGFYHPQGVLSRDGTVNIPMVLVIPPGEDPAIRQRAFWQSFNYQCRLRFDPRNGAGVPMRARAADGSNTEYVRGRVRWRIDSWRPATWRRQPAMAAVMRIGPQP